MRGIRAAGLSGLLLFSSVLGCCYLVRGYPSSCFFDLTLLGENKDCFSRPSQPPRVGQSTRVFARTILGNPHPPPSHSKRCFYPPPSTVFLLSPISPLSPAPGDEMFYTPQHAREGTPQNDKNGGSGFSFPPGGGAGGGAGSGGSVYVTPRSTPRYIDGGASTDGGVDSRRGAYAHQVGTWGAVSKSFVRQMCVCSVWLGELPTNLASSLLFRRNLRTAQPFVFFAQGLISVLLPAECLPASLLPGVFTRVGRL